MKMVFVSFLATAMFLTWFINTVKQAHDTDPPLRAITVAQHHRCVDMPNGNQEMEERKHECFSKLYGEGRFAISRGLMDLDQ